MSAGSGSLFYILLLCRIMDIAYCMAIILIFRVKIISGSIICGIQVIKVISLDNCTGDTRMHGNDTKELSSSGIKSLKMMARLKLRRQLSEHSRGDVEAQACAFSNNRGRGLLMAQGIRHGCQERANLWLPTYYVWWFANHMAGIASYVFESWMTSFNVHIKISKGGRYFQL